MDKYRKLDVDDRIDGVIQRLICDDNISDTTCKDDVEIEHFITKIED